jgi:hypothetical protein
MLNNIYSYIYNKIEYIRSWNETRQILNSPATMEAIQEAEAEKGKYNKDLTDIYGSE